MTAAVVLRLQRSLLRSKDCVTYCRRLRGHSHTDTRISWNSTRLWYLVQYLLGQCQQNAPVPICVSIQTYHWKICKPSLWRKKTCFQNPVQQLAWIENGVLGWQMGRKPTCAFLYWEHWGQMPKYCVNGTWPDAVLEKVFQWGLLIGRY